MRMCLHQFARPRMTMPMEGRGDCTICMPHDDNRQCKMYCPINVTVVFVKEKEDKMEKELGNQYCGDCQDYAANTTEDGPNPYCMYHSKELTELELTIARNVPPDAYGFCPAFCPEDSIDEVE